jgi:hypothetical protein
MSQIFVLIYEPMNGQLKIKMQLCEFKIHPKQKEKIILFLFDNGYDYNEFLNFIFQNNIKTIKDLKQMLNKNLNLIKFNIL